ncbi:MULTISPECIES: hypothetical protein [Hyphomonas]|uniref:Uncharacterized protein n=1 Tax=Hyphomonas adhaerens TaxID=81029 RepID=A0A3B9GU05_9PROT|nr:MULTISPECIES: hypothetical protein [Hyphomonas]MBB40508.1 hypothetical protein [Hyphomonas sp.]HAE25848.1 hypothetical protein [Hyphomonas adhaerens]
MWRPILFLIAAVHSANALTMWFAPHFWYGAVPGVAMMGPFNLHFVRDIALAFGMSAGALAYSALKVDRSAAICGAAWPALHAIFHIWIWIARGLPFDQIAFVNLAGIQLPAWLALTAALTFTRKEIRA